MTSDTTLSPPKHQPVAAILPIAVVGGGPAGYACALLLAKAGIETALIAPPMPEDPRTSALMMEALRVLERIRLWPALEPQTGALRKMRVLDATRRLIRAPEATFDAAEMGFHAFGHNIPNAVLMEALRAAARETPRLHIHAQPVAEVIPESDHVSLRLADGAVLQARLVVGADGRTSRCRVAAGITSREEAYPQTAFVVNARHTLPHHDTSTEFHMESGPFTVVPLPGQRSSVVAVFAPERAREVMALGDEALSAELTRLSHGTLGALTPDGPRGMRPLSVVSVSRCAARRIALVGEAGHVLPPIGAQGLNLGLKDAQALADIVTEAARRGCDLGGEDVLAAYNAARRGDTARSTLMVDAFNRSLLSNLLPAQVVRGLGLWSLKSIGPLRRYAMRMGLGSRTRDGLFTPLS